MEKQRTFPVFTLVGIAVLASCVLSYVRFAVQHDYEYVLPEESSELAP